MTTSLSLAHQRNNKQTNKQQSSAQISHYTKLTQTTGPTLGGQKPKGRKKLAFKKRKKEISLEAWEKETSNTIS